MYTVVLNGTGGPEALELLRVDSMPLAPGEVRIDVAAIGINRADLLQRAGHYPPPSWAPPGIGLECSGTIAEVAADVTSWEVGDQVAALVDNGAYATEVRVPAGQLLPVTGGGRTLIEAAALPEAVCTAWTNLVDAAGLAAGDRVLIHGGSGGVGTIAIQLARMLGAEVAVTAAGPQRLARCRELGAQVLLDHTAPSDSTGLPGRTGLPGHTETPDRTRPGFADALRDEWPDGADVVLDIIGAKYLAANLAALADDGTLVVIGLQGGRRAELDLSELMSRRLTITGTTLRARTPQVKAAIIADVRARVWPAAQDGRIRPVVAAQFPLVEVAEAHRFVEAGGVFGKVLLRP